MPPSTFASAAASGNNLVDSSNEWSRRQIDSSRRNANQIQTPTDPSNPVYIPPHRNGAVIDKSRYSKDELLDIFHTASKAGALHGNISNLYVNGWEPNLANGSSAPWGRREDQKENNYTADICWDKDGTMLPVSAQEMTEEEEVFYNSVNSTLKPPNQNSSKETNPRESMNRKISNPQINPNYGLTSPTSRPNTRRRDTNELYPPQPNQQSTSSVTAPPASLMRRRTDYQKESPTHDDVLKDTSPRIDTGGFSSLKRSTAANATTTTTGGPTWGSTSTSTFSPIGGAFGSFGLTSPTNEKKSAFGSIRGESRFRNIMKDSSDDDTTGLQDKQNLYGLSQDNWKESKSTRLSEGTLPVGSAALQGGDDNTPPRESNSILSSIQDDVSEQDRSALRNIPQDTPIRRDVRSETLSPTNTNPYTSPENDSRDSYERQNMASFSSLGGFSMESEMNRFTALGGTSKPEVASPFGANDSFRSLGMLPGLGTSGTPGTSGISGTSNTSGWGQPPVSATANTPRSQTTFGTSFGDVFFSQAENPSLTNATSFGANTLLGGAGGFGRGSRLPALSSMERQDHYLPSTPGVIPQYGGYRENESSLSTSRLSDESKFNTNSFDMMTNNSGSGPGPGPIPVPDISREGPDVGSNNQIPTQQMRCMVMPDRIRWEYKDHEGRVQSPFSGLEMHDWYKAGYFTPELQIKKLEDPSFEPLAHLIRRIGNSREPFLVPQVGFPHEPSTAQRGWAGAQSQSGGGIQPPFPNSFPSFGTTLTAEQQNDLERRKQESQYLMARQKEFLIQSQSMRMQQHPIHPPNLNIHPQPLHHQQSNQSLHSQPSYGSMTNAFSQMPPGNFQPQANVVSQSGSSTDGSFRSAPGPSSVSGSMEMVNQARMSEVPSMMSRMNLGGSNNTGFGYGHVNNGIPPESQPQHQLHGHGHSHAQQVANMLEDRARLEDEAIEAENLTTPLQNEMLAQAAAQRFQQFRDFREQPNIEGYQHQHQHQNQQLSEDGFENVAEPSMTQQVQAAVSAKSQPSKWDRMDMNSIVQPIAPPPQTTSPMAAPVAQRKSNVADRFNGVSSPSPVHTPAAETPTSLAPWAKETNEVPKLSLKEIQEAEAKKAALQEEQAAAAKRAALEREVVAAQQASLTLQPAPGLPSTSNWASSPTSTVPTTSVWTKSPNTRNTQTPSTAAKKTLQQIQKEEEARKQRNTTSSLPAMNGQAPIGLSSGKRYADLASKTTTGLGPTTTGGLPAIGGAWTTVGAGGKAKAPIPAPITTRSVSGNLSTTSSTTTPRPKAAVRSATLGSNAAIQGITSSKSADALDEVKRWAVKELTSHLNKGVPAQTFVETLLQLGNDPTIITEAVHASTQTIDSRHFTEEFIRRRKLADKGISTESSVPSVPSSVRSFSPSNAPPGMLSLPNNGFGIPSVGTSSSSTSGWNDVAKKTTSTPSSDNTQGSFKVVNRKKGLRR